MIKAISFFFLILVFLISAEWYQSQIIVMESWAYIIKDTETAKEDTLNNILLESTVDKGVALGIKRSEFMARNLAIEMFSGAVYGYDFSYAPPNSSRQIQEDWTIEPVAKISYEDTNLIEFERNIFNGELRIFYRYNLLDQQVRLLQSWEENSKVLYSKGEGISLNTISNSPSAVVSTITEEADFRIDALYDAIQEAIRNRVKDTLPKRTRIIHGRVKLASQPFFTDHISYYRARATIMLYINTIDLYEEF